MTNVTEVKAFLNGLYGHVYDSLDLIYGKERLNANINHHIIYRIMKDKRKMIAETLNHYRPFMI